MGRQRPHRTGRLNACCRLFVVGATGVAAISSGLAFTPPGPEGRVQFCAPSFAQNGTVLTNSTYNCTQDFRRICAKGFEPGAPTFVHLGGDRYRVTYPCSPHQVVK